MLWSLVLWPWLLSSFLEILSQGENCSQLDDAWQYLEKHPWKENAISWACNVFLISCNEKQDHIPVTYWQMLSEVSPVRGAEPGHALVQRTSYCSCWTTACFLHGTGLGSVPAPSLPAVKCVVSFPLSHSVVGLKAPLCTDFCGHGGTVDLLPKAEGSTAPLFIIHFDAGGFSA